MEKTPPETFEIQDCALSSPLPANMVLVVGAGHFGKRAVGILRKREGTPLLVVEKDETAISISDDDFLLYTALCDGASFLIQNFSRLHPENFIIPAVPLHLAFEWAKGLLQATHHPVTLPVPENILPSLPYTWKG